jgi:hypothetical protein
MLVVTHLLRRGNPPTADPGMSAIDATSDAFGKLYAVSQDPNAVFYTLKPPSTTANVVGNTGITSGGLAAVNAAGTQIFTVGATALNLYSINPRSGVALCPCSSRTIEVLLREARLATSRTDSP